MKFKRFAAILLAILLLCSLLLAGCGSRTETPDQTPIVNSTDVPAKSDTESPSAIVSEASPSAEVSQPEHSPVDALPATATLTLDEMLMEQASVISSYDELYAIYSGVERSSEMYDDVLAKLDYSSVETIDDYAYADYTDLVSEISFVSVPTSALSGKRIAVISGDDVVIVSARGENSSEVFRFNASNAAENAWYGSDTPVGVIYIDDILYVFTYESSVTIVGNTYETSERTHIKRYDVSGDSKGILLSDFAQDGRLTGVFRSGNQLLVLTAASTGDLTVDSSAHYIPSVEHDGVDSDLSVGSIIRTPFTDSLEYSMLTVYDLAKGKDTVSVALTGYYSHGYLHGDCVYLLKCSTSQVVHEAEPLNQYLVNRCTVGTITNVVSLSLADSLALRNTISANGYLPGLESFWIDSEHVYLATVTSDINYRIFTDPEWGFVNYVTDSSTPEANVTVLDSSLNFESSKAIPCSATPSRIVCIGNTIWALNPATGFLAPLEDYDRTEGNSIFYLKHYNKNTFVGASYQNGAYQVSLVSFDGSTCSVAASATFDSLLLSSPLHLVDDHIVTVDSEGFTRFTESAGSLLRAGRLSSYFLSGETDVHIANDYYFCSGSAMLVADKDWNVEAVVSFAFG